MGTKATKAQMDALRERGELAPNMRFNGTRYETYDAKKEADKGTTDSGTTGNSEKKNSTTTNG